jgi:hypothetical protein
MHVPFNGLLEEPTGVSGMKPLGFGASARIIGLKLTLTSWSANSCSWRNWSSAG